MHGIMEAGFDVVYLVTVVTIGIIMIVKSKGNKQYLLFGIMAVVLGAGDAFHLVPRAIALLTTGFQDYLVPLGIGKLVTSITMTIFYLILYYVWRIRYKVQGKSEITAALFVLAAIRIGLCLFPQNQWTSDESPLSWAIYRNIPFAIMGIIVIVLFYQSTKGGKDRSFRFMWLTIVLSFAFYIPVVLWAETYSWVGMLMIPKTLVYVWTILIGFMDMRKNMKEKKLE